MRHTLNIILIFLVLDTNIVFGQQIEQNQVDTTKISLNNIEKGKFERETSILKTDMTSYFHKKDSVFQLNLGKQYPVFKATSLDGQTIEEKGLVGKVSIINFWFKYCKPCVAEMDELCILQQKFIENPAFQFISFTSDSSDDAKESVEKLQLSFPVYPISRNECYRLNFNQGFPTTIIVDKVGKIVFLKSGGSLEKEKIAQDIRNLEQIIENELNVK